MCQEYFFLFLVFFSVFNAFTTKQKISTSDVSAVLGNFCWWYQACTFYTIYLAWRCFRGCIVHVLDILSVCLLSPTHYPNVFLSYNKKSGKTNIFRIMIKQSLVLFIIFLWFFSTQRETIYGNEDLCTQQVISEWGKACVSFYKSFMREREVLDLSQFLRQSFILIIPR